MTLPLPTLDDRSYAELTAEAQALIPGLFPDWTNHNPSDPGVVLVELLAWLTEMTLFQLDQIPAKNVETFLGLLGNSQPAAQESAVRDTLRTLREQYRAVTATDFERLALEQWPSSEGAVVLGEDAKILRTHCVPRCNLSLDDRVARNSTAPGHTSLVVLAENGDPFAPSPALLQGLHAFLDPRRLLTVRHHVVGPRVVAVEISATLYLREDAPPEQTLNSAIAALNAYFDPRKGGPQGRGWPFGRAVYASEVYALLDAIDLIEYIDPIRLSVAATDTWRMQTHNEETIGIVLDADELVAVKVGEVVAVDTGGRRYLPRPVTPGNVVVT
jgi:hypothetical protein